MYTLKELQQEIERAAQNGDDLGFDVSFADELLYVRYIQDLYFMLTENEDRMFELGNYATNKLFDMFSDTFGERFL